MKLNSKFEINDTFKITRRVIVLAGNVSEGVVGIGNYIVFKFTNKELSRRITGVEGIRSERNNNCGLLIETESEQEIIDLKNWVPNGITGLIYELN